MSLSEPLTPIMKMNYFKRFSCWSLAIGLAVGSAGFTCELARGADALPPGSIEPAVRNWSDATGQFHTEATLLSTDQTEVHLRKSSGSIIGVPVSRLSDTDRAYLRERARTSGTSIEGTAESETTGLAYLVRKPIVSDAIAAVRLGAEMSRPAAVPENMIYVRLSRPYLQHLAARDVSRRRAVHDNILGSPVTGVSQTDGTSTLALRPNSEFGQVELVFSGATTYHTVADAGPIQVHVSGVTEFSSSKAVWIDEHGMHVGKAVANTLTTSKITGIDTTLPGLRGRLALSIGGRPARGRTPRGSTGDHRRTYQKDWQIEEVASPKPRMLTSRRSGPNCGLALPRCLPTIHFDRMAGKPARPTTHCVSSFSAERKAGVCRHRRMIQVTPM